MPYKKLQKIKNLFLIIFLLFTYSFFLYYISKQATFVANAWTTWYSSTWRYRRVVTVTNPGSAGSYDVLVQLSSPYDPYSLYTAGKLQSDCDDFLFTLSNDSAVLSFWLENGCNTSTNSSTQIWVRIPSLPAGTSYINMYYSNPSATNAEASWTGNFILMNDSSSCPTGWTSNSYFQKRIPYPSTAYGVQSGFGHNHGTASCTKGPSATVVRQSGTGQAFATSTHVHAGQSTTPDTWDGLPPYYSLMFCDNPDLNIASGMITYFTSTPSGWTRFSTLDSRFPVGCDYINGSYQCQVTGGSDVHNHSCNGTSNTGNPNAYLDAVRNTGAGTYETERYHGHTVADSTSTDSSSMLPPYRSIIFASKDSSGTAGAGLISMTSATPPLGWTRYSAQDGRFPYGSATVGTTGGTSNTHTHTTSLSTGTASDIYGVTGTGVTVTPQHTHNSCTATLPADSLGTPASYVYLYERNTSLNTSVGSEEKYNTFPNAPTSLLTEGLTNPQKITDLTPEFSAVFSDTDTSDTGNYYQIQVNTQSDFLGTSMWDSTKTATGPITNGARSSDISYAGTTLVANGVVYYWRIKFWDYLNEESEWSSTANFATRASPNAPTDLLTDGNTNPLFIMSLTPSFSAIHTDGNTDNAIYYQIEVNTQSDFLGTSMWNTNKTSTTSISSGSRSPDYVYAGTTLTSNSVTYYWHIRFWDTDDDVSNWSETASFKSIVNKLSLKGVSLKGLSID